MIDTDAVVIGAGPVGLFQVFQLGLLGIKAEIIDVLPEPGGQCAALYPDKPIYDVPGVPVCTGRELTQLLMTQARPFLKPAAVTDGQAASFPSNLHLGHLVAELRQLPEGGFGIITNKGLSLRARAVFVAAGAGAFVPKTLSLPGIDTAANVHYHLYGPHDRHHDVLENHGDTAGQDSDLPSWAGKHLVIWGGGDEALSAAIALATENDPARIAARLTLLHRRDQYQADAALETQVQALIAEGRIEAATGLPTGSLTSEAQPGFDADTDEPGRLVGLQLLGSDGNTTEIRFDHLMIRLGMSPKLGPLSDWGLMLERKQVSVSPATFESSVPGVHAVGDINTYPGKKRLLLCGFHEATLAAHHAAAALKPDAPQHLLYTTTSPLLHQRLGLSG